MGGSLKSVLFVDFDNVYSGLTEVGGQRLALRFANAPERWVNWLRGAKLGVTETPQPQRRILSAFCYLNSDRYYRFRGAFARQAFRVVDCPSLTQQGKNSADMYMALDIVDALSHPIGYEEFIILSGDTDFVPVLLRLRANARRTVVCRIRELASAYIAASDYVIETSEFVTDALDVRPDSAPPPAAPAPPQVEPQPLSVQQRVVAAIRELLREADSPLPTTSLGNQLRRHFGDASTWLGKEKLTDFLHRHGFTTLRRGDVVLLIDPGRHAASEQRPSEPVPGRAATPAEPIRAAAMGGQPRPVEPEPQADEHESEPLDESDEVGDAFDDILDEVESIHEAANLPFLTQEQYEVFFAALSDELRQRPLAPNRTALFVRTACTERGEPIEFHAISNVLHALARSTPAIVGRTNAFPPRVLASMFCKHVFAQAEGSGHEFTSDSEQWLVWWITGEWHARAGLAT